MIRSSVIAGIILLTLASACRSSTPEHLPRHSIQSSLPEALEQVPFVALLVNPDAYVNRRVWVTGVAYFHPEGSGLYLTREHYQVLTEDRVGLSVDLLALGSSFEELSTLNGHYVSAVGEVVIVSEPGIGKPRILLTGVSRIDLLE